MKITDFVTSTNVAVFNRYRQNTLYYRVFNVKTSDTYEFPIPTEDLGHATVNKFEKALTLMRYIRKAIEANELVKVADEKCKS